MEKKLSISVRARINLFSSCTGRLAGCIVITVNSLTKFYVSLQTESRQVRPHLPFRPGLLVAGPLGADLQQRNSQYPDSRDRLDRLGGKFCGLVLDQLFAEDRQ